MRRRLWSIAAALALCLGLLPGTALAEEGTVTITGTGENAGPVTLEDGKAYVSNGDATGVRELEASEERPNAYLTYDNGVLTVVGDPSNSVDIKGTMAVTGDLEIKASPTNNMSFVSLDFNAYGGAEAPALALNGHTLTLDPEVGIWFRGYGQPAVDGGSGGTIQYSQSGGLESNLRMSSDTDHVLKGELTVKNARLVKVLSFSESGSGPAVENLTVENCDDVSVEGSYVEGSRFTLSHSTLKIGPWGSEPSSCTLDLDGTWTYGGEISNKFNFANVSKNTCYQAGAGAVYYEPAREGTTAKMTLKNATCQTITHLSNNISQLDGDLQLDLVGENRIQGNIDARGQKVMLTGNGRFEGTIQAWEFENNSSASLNGTVIMDQSEDWQNRIQHTFIYGEQSLVGLQSGYFSIFDNSTLTITSGAELTIPVQLLIGGLDALRIEDSGKIINNSEIMLLDTAFAGEDIPAYIKSLGLTGSGKVTVRGQEENSNPKTPSATYANNGKRLREPAGRLDFSDPNAPAEGAADTGYIWDAATKTLTLQEGFNADKVTLPDDTVTIVTEGESTIGTLEVQNNNPQKTNLTLSGAGPLTVQQELSLCGGNGSSLTVNAEAVVVLENGASVSGTGGANGLVTVNGNLTAAGGAGGTALITGKVSVGPQGELNVSGQQGIELNGVDGSFANAFALAAGGRFTANCPSAITLVNQTDESLKVEDVISVPSGYLPPGCKLEFNNGTGTLSIPGGSGSFTISADNQASHVHTWAADWTTNSPHHWHECAAGCPVTENSQKEGYGVHVYDNNQDGTCNVCGYERVLEPSNPSDGGTSSGGGHSGGGGGSVRTYAVTVEKPEHGKVTLDRANAGSGSAVTLTVTPDSGYALEELTVTGSRGNAVELTDQGGGKYVFTMPGSAVTVKAVFAPVPDGTQKPCGGGADCPSRGFADLGGAETWYHEAVDYVLRNNLMGGSSSGTFGPNDTLTRAQFAQILFNKEGRPAVGYQLQYSDVTEDEWYAGAVRWAGSRGIVGGYGNGMFGPNDNITREQLAVMLWRYAGSPAAAGEELRFNDADRAGGYALDALRWAVENGVMRGKSGGVLDPQGLATRAQAAQMLKNFWDP